MDYENRRFKIGITFSGKYREQYILPICESLLRIGYKKEEIFYDYWHEHLLNGVYGDSALRKIYYQQCDCVVVLLSPDYRERNWPGHIEWPAIKELIITGGEEKVCLLGVDEVDISKIDGLYPNQTIIKFIDDIPADEVADFIYKKYMQIVERGRHEESCQYTHFVLDETRRFIKELNSLNVMFANGSTINIIGQLKATPREGKRVRLIELENTKIIARTVFDHMISLAYLADVADVMIDEGRWNASEIAQLIAYHEIAEALIGDIASYTASEPPVKISSAFKTDDREMIVNRFISLYADKKQFESIGYLNNRIKPAGKRKSELSDQMAYFKALDHLDCLVAVWRYLFYYRRQCTQQQLLEFIDVMSDFFNNQRLKKEDMLVKVDFFRQMISFLSDKRNAKKYVAGNSIKKLFKEKESIVDAVTYLIEKVPLFGDT